MIKQNYLKKISTFVIPIISILMIFAILKGGSSNDSIYIVSSPIMRPIAENFAARYRETHKKPVFIDSKGNNIALDKVLSKKSDLGFILRPLSDNENTDLKYETIGYDALVLIANDRNPVSNLDKKQVLDIYTRKIKNWKEISGKDEPVFLASQKTGGDSSVLFEKYSGLKNPGEPEKGPNGYISEDTHITSSELETIGFVGRLIGAIGFTSLESALYMKNNGMSIKILSLDGIKPDPKNIKDGKYPVSTAISIVYRENNTKVTRFLEVSQTPEAGKVLEEFSFIPLISN